MCSVAGASLHKLCNWIVDPLCVVHSLYGWFHNLSANGEAHSSRVIQVSVRKHIEWFLGEKTIKVTFNH